MADEVIQYVFQYAGYVLELSLLVCLLRSCRARRLVDVSIYVFLLLLTDAVARPVVQHAYGFESTQYAYFYWLTDVLLTLAAFLLVCSFFRRAFARSGTWWPYLKLVLPLVFILIVAISWYSISQHYTEIYSRFIIELEQNLYFACLVLTTVLYVVLQGIETADEEFHLLVCGLGLQFAGPAANMALISLTPGRDYGGSVLAYVGPTCTLAMLSLWLYAVARVPKPVRVRHVGGDARVAVPA